jgi:GTP-binding protein
MALAEGRALVIGANKWDLVEEPQAARRALEALAAEKLPQVRGVRVVTLSALTGRGLDRLLPEVVQTFERWRSRVTTGQLNRWLAAALERHPPPLVQKRRLKFRFVTQTSSRPPTFTLFANKPAEQVPDSYLRYLASGLRESFDLAGVPLRLQVRHGENPYDPT